MSMLSCPMCGKQNSLRYFSPESLAEDIQLVERKSLGRGRGFAVTGRPSILDDTKLTARIATRCHILLSLIEGKKQAIDEDEREEFRDRINELQEALDDYEESWDKCLSIANNALPDTYEEFSDLEAVIKTLSTEYSDCIEESEDDQ